MAQKRIVIIGGGFGGLYAAQGLGKADCEVLLIDRRNFHLFQPLLYQVATGGLSPADIASPLRAILRHNKNTSVLLGDVTHINRVDKTVTVNQETIPYDYLVVAAGSQNFYYGQTAWEADIPGLKTVEEALEIRQRILYAFEAAERCQNEDEIAQWLTFAIIGGGPTGVELAGAIAEIAFHIMRNDFHRIDPTKAVIYLIENNPQILSGMPDPLPQKALTALKRMGVQVLTGYRLHEKKGLSLYLTSKTENLIINTHTVLWAAGVRPSSLTEQLIEEKSQLDGQGRIIVTDQMRLPTDTGIFVIGDMAHVTDHQKQPLPALAPVAMQQGKYVAQVISNDISKRPNKPFRYFNKGSLATIGRHQAVGIFGSLKVSGFTAWVLWLFVHLMYLVEFDNRVLVLFQWAWNYITKNRGARLITPQVVPEMDDITGNTGTSAKKNR